MNYLLSYDISNDKSRKRVSDYLLEKGFLRIQNSVFLGEIHITKIDDILENICLLVDKKRIQYFVSQLTKKIIKISLILEKMKTITCIKMKFYIYKWGAKIYGEEKDSKKSTNYFNRWRKNRR
ncbi:CRISPR-associated endonuclease Cas2 [Fusobacterium nucleatum]